MSACQPYINFQQFSLFVSTDILKETLLKDVRKIGIATVKLLFQHKFALCI